MPIMARTSGGIYTAVSDIYDTQGNAISTVYDTQGNVVFSSNANVTDEIVFNSALVPQGTYDWQSWTVKAGESKSGNARTYFQPLTFYGERSTKTPQDCTNINMGKYKGWHLRGQIHTNSYPASVSDAIPPDLTIELGYTNKDYVQQSGTFSFNFIKQIGYCYKEDKYISIDETIPDVPNCYNLNLALRMKYGSWYYNNTTTKSKTLLARVDLLEYPTASIRLYKS